MKHAFVLGLGIVALAGCGGVRAIVAPSGHGVLHSLSRDKAAEIGAARRANADLFRIFPARVGSKSCAIPNGGMSAVPLRGTCRTSITYPTVHGPYSEAFVRFAESWGQGHSSAWTLIVQWPLLKVVATQLHGETSPQMRYAVSDKTPGDQPALDSAAGYAERVAGAAHVFAGLTVDDPTDTVHLNLVHAPRSLIAKLRAAFPRTYVIDNHAPRTWHDVTRLQKELNRKALLANHGIDMVMSAPTQNGHLRVGVRSSVAKAQVFFDRKYGTGVIRVVHAEPGVAL